MAQRGLKIRNVSVRFGGVRAVDDVSVTFAPGRLHGIIGPNGSGKTTLLNAISGFVHATGLVTLDGHDISRMPPHRRVRRGLSRTFQNPRGDHTLTVRDLLRLGEHREHHQPCWMVAVAPLLADRSARETTARAQAFLERVGLDPSILDTPLEDLPAGVMKLVDIGRALAGKPRVLLLDEPTSGMNESEIERLGDVLADLCTDDVTIVLVEHNLRFVDRTCDIVTVLAGGAVIGEGDLSDVLNDKNVIEAYFGGVPAAAYR